jgi:hypothetical protein
MKAFMVLSLLLSSKPALSEWSFGFYSGAAIEDPLVSLIRFSPPTFRRDYISVLALSRPFFSVGEYLDFEWEAQVGTSYEGWDSFQFNAAWLTRWSLLPWDRYFQGGSFAMGHGLSYAILPSAPEREGKTDPSSLLYYLMLEFSFPVFGTDSLELFSRIHHRSGVFGFVGQKREGSNFLCLGLRISL